MDQIKIGKFIAKCRKQNGLTQIKLAEKLNITDKAVSKWETGKTLPDPEIMLELCKIFGITVNDLLNGEVINMENYKEKTEELLMEMIKQKEKQDKKLLSLEILIGMFASIIFLVCIFTASFCLMENWLRICIIFIGFILFIIGVVHCIEIEQTAGYYKCAECGHVYIPTYKAVFFAPHINRTRKMKCPNCGQKSWNKKVLTKEEN